MKNYYVYMLANQYNSVFYVGVTNNIVRRMYEHRNKKVKGFTEKYKCSKLVWFEQTNNIEEAILQEKRMKKWRRIFKRNLVNTLNPKWRDLSEEF